MSIVLAFCMRHTHTKTVIQPISSAKLRGKTQSIYFYKIVLPESGNPMHMDCHISNQADWPFFSLNSIRSHLQFSVNSVVKNEAQVQSHDK